MTHPLGTQSTVMLWTHLLTASYEMPLLATNDCSWEHTTLQTFP